jgi:hypothetical protein
MVLKGGVCYFSFFIYIFLGWPRGCLVILKNKYYKKLLTFATHMLAHARSSGDQNQSSTMMFGVAHCPLRIGEMCVNGIGVIGLWWASFSFPLSFFSLNLKIHVSPFKNWLGPLVSISINFSSHSFDYYLFCL